MMLRPLLAACVILLAGCSQPERARDPNAGTVQVTDAVCRPSAEGRRMTVCFATLTASRADTLVSASSPLAARVALQDVPLENGMIVLQPRSGGVPLPAGQTVRLAGGGQAIVLQGLETPLVEGQTAPLTLTFATSAPVEVVARVGAEPAP